MACGIRLPSPLGENMILALSLPYDIAQLEPIEQLPRPIATDAKFLQQGEPRLQREAIAERADRLQCCDMLGEVLCRERLGGTWCR